MKQVLTDEGVDTHHMLLDDNQRTSTVIVDLDDQGERSFTFMVKPSADQFIQPEDVPEFNKGDWLHVCSIALANNPSRLTTFHAMQMMHRAGGYISFDPNLREEVWSDPSDIRPVVLEAVAMADVVKFSDDELCFLAQNNDLEASLKWLQANYKIPLVVITQGKKGALVVQEEDRQLITGKPVNPVDTTGAGDAFVGGMLEGLVALENWVDNDKLKDVIKQANACGALATTSKGAMTALPNRAELEQYLQ